MTRVENFIGPHHRYQIFCFAQVNNIVRITRQHMNRLNLLSTDFEFNDFIRSDFPLLNQAMAGDYDNVSFS